MLSAYTLVASVFIISTVIGLIIEYRRQERGSKTIKTLLWWQFGVTLLAIVINQFININNQKQQNLIEDTVTATQNLSEEIKKLEKIDSIISERIKTTVDSNMNLSNQTKLLASQIKEIAKLSNELSIRINERTKQQADEVKIKGFFQIDPKRPDSFVLKIGDGTAIYTRETLERGVDVFTSDPGRTSILRIKLVDRSFFITASFYDVAGNLIAEIRDNEWAINPNNIFSKNFDSQALEVIDQRGNVNLQIQFDNHSIALKGVLLAPFGAFVFADDRIRLINKGEKHWEAQVHSEAKKIKRLFKHGGNNYLGKRAN